MGNPQKPIRVNHDTNAENRKKDHIDLAFEAHITDQNKDTRFDYEPLLASNTFHKKNLTTHFLNKELGAPIWISSMTGGTAHAKNINQNLAMLCGQYKLGMGLGSCRQLLYSDEFLSDFAVRKFMPDQPLYANLGIAQIEYILRDNKSELIRDLIDKLDADGLIIHVNPLQEWLQPEGDKYTNPPIDTITQLLDTLDIKIIVKEVGQGMGPASLNALMQLPIEAIDFGALGGTNFAALEILRAEQSHADPYRKIPKIGHTAIEMVGYVNDLINQNPDLPCKQVIISGGVSDFLDGFHLTKSCQLSSIYGHASVFLKYALLSYEELQAFFESQIEGLAMAHALLRIPVFTSQVEH